MNEESANPLSDADRAVGEIYVKHRIDLLRFIKKELKLNDDDAEDLVPHVFLKLTRRFQEGNPPKDPLNWLFEVAKNEGLEMIRKEGIRETCSLGADGIPSDVVDRNQRGVESKIISGEVKAVTREALMGLPESTRTIVRMHLEQRMEFPDIAAALGLPTARVERLCEDALRSIQDRLGAMWSSMVREADSRDHTPTTRGKMLEALQKLGRYAPLLLLRHEEKIEVARIAIRLKTPMADIERDLSRAYELLERRFGLSPDGLDAVLGKAD